MFSAFPTIPPQITTQLSLVTTIITIVLLIIIELKSHEDETHTSFPRHVLYPIVTVFGLLVIIAIVKQILKI